MNFTSFSPKIYKTKKEEYMNNQDQNDSKIESHTQLHTQQHTQLQTHSQTQSSLESSFQTQQSMQYIDNNSSINSLNHYNETNIYCLNCGKKGHVIKKCLQPIISIGIICIRLKISLNMNDIINYSKKIQNNYLFSLDEINKLKKIKNTLTNFNIDELDSNVDYLFIRRKNSLNYVEFMRGKYDLDNTTYLENILNLISEEERKMLLTHDFQDLWNKLWEYNKKNNNNEYKNSEAKFNILKKGYYTKKNEINIFINLEIIIQNSRKVYNYPEPEWGFPKGRRNLKEKNVDCAKREFEEETNFLSNEYHILNMNPLEEIYLSTNYSKYKHIYYISQINNIHKKIELDPENINQKIEIGDINWYSFEEGSQKIRNYNIEKRNVLYTLHNTIRFTIINFKEILNNFLEFL